MKSLRACHLAVLLIGCVTTCRASAQQGVVQWHRIATEYYNFLRSPLGSTALPLVALLPKTAIPYSGNAEEQQAKSYLFENLLPLEGRILKGDQQSMRLAFSLYPISDGAFTETLNIIIGESIRPFPKLFLAELADAKLISELLPGLLGNCGEAFVDAQAAECKELKKRRSALQSVRGPQLQKVKQVCIDELSRQLKEECNAV